MLAFSDKHIAHNELMPHENGFAATEKHVEGVSLRIYYVHNVSEGKAPPRGSSQEHKQGKTQSAL